MKTISISIPTYNEEDNVLPLYEALREQLAALEGRYDYEILFIDNKSTDGTREKLKLLCERDKRVKAIFNARNVGQENSQYYATLQTTGDCTISMSADFQDPPELLPRMVEAWEQGYKIVCMVKTTSRENPFMRFLRTVYYKAIRRISNTEIIEHFAGFGLYDKSSLDIARRVDDPEPFTRGMVTELGYGRVILSYTQPRRRAGQSSNHFSALYDRAMLSVVTYTRAGLRLATLFGLLVAGAGFAAALVLLILRLAGRNNPAPIDPMALLASGMFFLGGVQMFFLGLLGEYVIAIHRRSMKRPLVIEEARLNFEEEAQDV